MIQKLFWAIISVCFIQTAALAQMPANADQARDYEHCTSLVNSDPAGALTLAELWNNEFPSMPAAHCRALALFALGRYPESASALEKLTATVGKERTTLWVSLLQQASAAWETAGNSARAKQLIYKAIQDAESGNIHQAAELLLLDRAQALIKKQKTTEAMQDLDHLLTINPASIKALEMRAEQLVALKEFSLAKADVAQLKALDAANLVAATLDKKIQSATAKPRAKKRHKATKSTKNKVQKKPAKKQ